VSAAQEGGNQALEAVAWGRMSFTWTYSQHATEALSCIQEARRLAAHNVNAMVRAYLAAVEAEIQATLEQRAACLEALDVAEEVEDRQYSKEEIYWLNFDRSRLAGYQGICFRRLYHPDDARTQSFLNKAQQALTEALSLLDPARIQRRPTLLIDLASTYAQQGDVDGASEHAMQSLSILAQTKSQTTVKRLLAFRQELEPWQDTQSVKNLDEQIVQHISMSG
jgi:tetratricopeptide (TPR) repeat protein